MKRRLFLTALLVTLLMGLTARAEGPDAKQRTEALIKAFLAVKPMPEDGKALPEADRKSNAAVFEQLDGFFDYKELVSVPLAPHAKAFEAAQLEAAKKAFQELIRLIAYPDSGGFFKRAKYTLGPAKPGRDAQHADVTLEASLPEEDMETTVTFHWRKADGVWRIIDASFDGSSLIKDYSNQFGRIITKEGAAGLIKRIDKKLAATRTARAGMLP